MEIHYGDRDRMRVGEATYVSISRLSSGTASVRVAFICSTRPDPVVPAVSVSQWRKIAKTFSFEQAERGRDKKETKTIKLIVTMVVFPNGIGLWAE